MANDESHAAIPSTQEATEERAQHRSALPGTASRHEKIGAMLASAANGLGARARIALRVGVSLTALAGLVVIVRDVAIGEVLGVLVGANLTILLVVLPALAAGTLLRLVRWKYLLLPFKEVTLAPLVAPLLISYAVANVTLSFVGAVPRIYLLSRRTGIDGTFTAGVLVLEYFLDTAALVIWASIIPFLVYMTPEFQQGQVVLIPLSVLFLLFGFALWRRKSLLIGLLTLLKVWEKVLHLLPEWINVRIESFQEGLSAVFAHRRASIMVLLSTVIIWADETLVFWLLLQSLGVPFGFLHASAIMAFAHVVTGSLPVPGSIGTLELAVVTLVLALGGQHEAALAYALLLHLFSLGPVTLVGLFFAWREGWRLGGSSSQS
ncbi:MAG: flippase-like domain-containing protein [Chloroflexi bacterium]|nr:flippase-like domain-containing protein [Chloroflexota bacterium]